MTHNLVIAMNGWFAITLGWQGYVTWLNEALRKREIDIKWKIKGSLANFDVEELWERGKSKVPPLPTLVEN
jgi:hypothetical protein